MRTYFLLVWKEDDDCRQEGRGGDRVESHVGVLLQQEGVDAAAGREVSPLRVGGSPTQPFARRKTLLLGVSWNVITLILLQF